MNGTNSLDYEVTESESTGIDADLLVVPVAVKSLKAGSDPTLDALSEASDIDLRRLADRESFNAGPLDTLIIRPISGVRADRLLLVGTGDDEDHAEGALRRAAAKAAREARKMKAAAVAFAPARSSLGDDEIAAQLVEGFSFGAYEFERYITPEEDDFEGFDSLALLGTSDQTRDAVAQSRRVASAVDFARDLVNEPAVTLTPEEMALRAEDIGSEHGLETTILDENELAEKGFNLITAVGRGSANAPRLIHLVYRPDGEVDRRIAFVGKGVTFDTGGNSMKSPKHMKYMHADMGGAAAVLGAADALGALEPEGVEIHFVAPSAENTVSRDAIRPQDIVRGYGGQSVEIDNTDAEGRLLLADALSYIQEHDVDTIIDLATLTGSCVVALGDHTAGLFTDSDALESDLQDAARRAGEDIWPLPLNDRLDEKLETPVADMKNVGDRSGGAITAALFLRRWIDIDDWAHLDIAGPAYAREPGDFHARGGTGFGVATLTRFALAVGR